MDFEKIKNLNVLKKSESILNGLVIEEEINTTDLLKLLNSNLLKTTFNNPTSRKIYENEKHQLNCYFKLVKNGIAYVKYEKVKNMPSITKKLEIKELSHQLLAHFLLFLVEKFSFLRR